MAKMVGELLALMVREQMCDYCKEQAIIDSPHTDCWHLSEAAAILERKARNARAS